MVYDILTIVIGFYNPANITSWWLYNSNFTIYGLWYLHHQPVFDLQPKEKGFISKTAHGCELDGWDGVQAPMLSKSVAVMAMAFLVNELVISMGLYIHSINVFLVLITGIARALTVVKSGFLGGEVMVNYLLVMTNGSLLKIPHLVRWFTYSKWWFSIVMWQFTRGYHCFFVFEKYVFVA